jgi:glycosyltransferase involved in cell wall biosynthesis
VLTVALITRGSPTQITGGHLYQHHLAMQAAAHDATIHFVQARGARNPFASHSDIVVVDSITAWSVAPWATLHPPPVPLVAIVHQRPGGPRSRWAHRVQAALDRTLYRQCDLLITPSSSLADRLVSDHRQTAARITVIEPGSDLSDASETTFDLRMGRRTAFLSVSNWLPDKGVLELLDAVAAAPHDHVTLHLVGRKDVDPDYTRRVRARLRHGDLRDRVVVHGALAQHDVAALHAGADVFALPSYAETYGMSVAEALRAGLPVIAWRAGNVPSLVEHGCDGLLVEPGDVRGLTAAVRRLAADERLRSQMSQTARERAAGRPTWADTAATFFSTLHRLANRHG